MPRTHTLGVLLTRMLLQKLYRPLVELVHLLTYGSVSAAFEDDKFCLRKRTETRQIAHEQCGLGALWHNENFLELPPYSAAAFRGI